MTKSKDADAVLEAIYRELEGYFGADADLDEAEETALPQQAEAAAQCGTGMNKVENSTGMPWDDLTGIKETNLLYKMPPEIVAKMLWIMENVPKMSKQRLVRDGTNMLIGMLIDKHYKP